MRRRALLKAAAGVTATAGLAGCSQFGTSESSTTTSEQSRVLERVVLRADTDREEPLTLTLTYVDPEGDKHRPLWGTYSAPASGNLYQLSDFDGHPGVYSLTVHSHEHDSVETLVTHAGPDDRLQFEVVVQRHGAVWGNVGDAGNEVSIPGYSPDDVGPS
ncbi:hypothetical protein [Halobacterium yunchengense]|uniref:hypothetical protein n=1 Tax=Halobacterium yunchengense TaxID=3108497 RepID=UPI00300BD411